MRKTLAIAVLAAVAVAPVYISAQPGPQGGGKGPQQQGEGKGPQQGAGKGIQQGAGKGIQQGEGKGLQQGGGKGQPQRRMMRETIYGSPLMTLEERQAHQQKMWSAKTNSERQAIRDANRKAMIERAKTRGVKIDETKSDVFWREE